MSAGHADFTANQDELDFIALPIIPTFLIGSIMVDCKWDCPYPVVSIYPIYATLVHTRW